MRAWLVVLFFASTASAQECKTWDQVTAHLNSYGQIQSARAITDRSSNLIAIFVNPTNDTWSIVERPPTGCTRVQAQGIGWRWLYQRPRS